ncbi:MAG: lipopolysaccharide heptosyltransferase II [Candidatus Aminicenantes bacterium]|nr:lipopolysaccharide heptosyltransferase II [Candidatus Aminicenantes bacterium]
MRIAVRAPNWIGDSILSTPSIKSLKTNFPNSRLSVIAKPWVRDLFLNLEFVDDIISLPEKNDLKSLNAAVQKIKKQKFDAGLILPNSFISALLFYRARIPKRWGYKKDGRQILLTEQIFVQNPRKSIHQVQYYQNIISGLGLKPSPPQLHFSLTKQEQQDARNLLDSLHFKPTDKLVILNPGAYYGSAKRWPASRYTALAKILQKKSNPYLVLIGSQAEKELADSIASQMQNKQANLAGKTSLRILAGIISLADLVISNDSGPMHLSNALGIPIIALFGPTIPAATRPFHPPYKVIHKKVPCWPCFYRECPYEHQCMLQISPEEVALECEQILS